MIAALPMYDRPETAAALDRLWGAVRARLGSGPDRLTRGEDPWQAWRSPDLLLGQTCGFPFRARLHPRVTLVGTPVHRLDGCAPGEYRSVIVVRTDGPTALAEAAAGVLACNEALSQSGWAAVHAHLSAAGLSCGRVLRTGAHRASARAVAEGGADFAALDAVSWQMMRRWDGFAARLRVLEATAPTPALPFITAAGRDPAPLTAALEAAIEALDPQDRDTLCLHGLVQVPAAAYLAVPTPPPPPDG
jgi:ABC-type phosphate/phosphonate transport system substrate-binding protein